MIYLKLYKSKNFYFLVPLNLILTDADSYEKIKNLNFSKKPIAVNKLNLNNTEHELLSLIYNELAQTNLFDLFQNIFAIQFEKL